MDIRLRRLTWLMVVLPIVAIGFSCANKAKEVCKYEAQQNGTMKNVCRSNKQVPDAGVDGGKLALVPLSEDSYILMEFDKQHVLLDSRITFDVQLKTDKGFEQKGKFVASRSGKHEDAARLLLDKNKNFYAFVVDNPKALDNFIWQAQKNTSKSASADITYSFNHKSTSGRAIPLTGESAKIWEKVPGQPLQEVVTKFEPGIAAPLLRIN